MNQAAAVDRAHSAALRDHLDADAASRSSASIELADARARYERSLSAQDLCDEIDDDTVALVRAGDALALGRHLLGRVQHAIDRWADAEVFGEAAL